MWRKGLLLGTLLTFVVMLYSIIMSSTPSLSLLQLLLPNDGPPIPWDPRGDYRALNVDVFYKANSVKPLPIAECWKAGADRDASASDSYVPEGEAADAVGASWVRVPVAAPLATVLSAPDYVVPEVPVFYIVARSSPMWSAMRRAGPGGSFNEFRLPKAGK
jgi:hypothetical protein